MAVVKTILNYLVTRSCLIWQVLSEAPAVCRQRLQPILLQYLILSFLYELNGFDRACDGEASAIVDVQYRRNTIRIVVDLLEKIARNAAKYAAMGTKVEI